MKPSLLFTLGITTSILLSSICTQVAAQQYYKWVDAKGSTHYTTTPPPKNAKNQSKVGTYGWSNSAPYQPAAETKPEPVTQAPSNATPQSAPATAQQPDAQQREANKALESNQKSRPAV